MVQMQREDVSFRSGDDDCAAWLYRPASSAPHACVVLAHGFAATRDLRLDAFARRFADAGLTVLVFDYRHFGASGGEPRQWLDVGRQREDWRAAIAFARALPDVDPERVAIWGSSFSGGHVMALAATDSRIAAAIAQVPFCDGGAAPFSFIRSLRLAAHGFYDLARARLGLTPSWIPVVGPPGSHAVLTTPDSEPGFRALVPAGGHFDNRVAARIVLGVSTLKPAAMADRIACPFLVVVAEHDALTPPGPALAAAARAPKGETLSVDAGHFDVYVPPLFDRVVAAETGFLVKHLLPAS